jgi:hypothetical protein
VKFMKPEPLLALAMVVAGGLEATSAVVGGVTDDEARPPGSERGTGIMLPW